MEGIETLMVYPNPFRDHLVIRYVLDEPAEEVQFRIFGMNGSEISRITNIPRSAGVHTVIWYTTSRENAGFLLIMERKDMKGNISGIRKVIIQQ
jgi:hypothetical protein